MGNRRGMASGGERHTQAVKAAEILGVERTTLKLQDRLITDTVEARLHHGVFYARLPKWNELAVGEHLKDTCPHEIDRFFFGHCRIEPAWDRFDFAVDVSDVYDVKMAAIRVYESDLA